MAPETLMSGQISRASDVYAYGIMLWELYTGARLIDVWIMTVDGFKSAEPLVFDASSCMPTASCPGSCTQVRAC
jgi:serine/threonine protein kinase